MRSFRCSICFRTSTALLECNCFPKLLKTSWLSITARPIWEPRQQWQHKIESKVTAVAKRGCRLQSCQWHQKQPVFIMFCGRIVKPNKGTYVLESGHWVPIGHDSSRKLSLATLHHFVCVFRCNVGIGSFPQILREHRTKSSFTQLTGKLGSKGGERKLRGVVGVRKDLSIEQSSRDLWQRWWWWWWWWWGPDSRVRRWPPP